MQIWNSWISTVIILLSLWLVFIVLDVCCCLFIQSFMLSRIKMSHFTSYITVQTNSIRSFSELQRTDLPPCPSLVREVCWGVCLIWFLAEIEINWEQFEAFFTAYLNYEMSMLLLFPSPPRKHLINCCCFGGLLSLFFFLSLLLPTPDFPNLHNPCHKLWTVSVSMMRWY